MSIAHLSKQQYETHAIIIASKGFFAQHSYTVQSCFTKIISVMCVREVGVCIYTWDSLYI